MSFSIINICWKQPLADCMKDAEQLFLTNAWEQQRLILDYCSASMLGADSVNGWTIQRGLSPQPGPTSSCHMFSDSQFWGMGHGHLTPHSMMSPVNTIVLLKDSLCLLLSPQDQERKCLCWKDTAWGHPGHQRKGLCTGTRKKSWETKPPGRKLAISPIWWEIRPLKCFQKLSDITLKIEIDGFTNAENNKNCYPQRQPPTLAVVQKAPLIRMLSHQRNAWFPPSVWVKTFSCEEAAPIPRHWASSNCK